MTVMGDAYMEELSDAGSIPAWSIVKRRLFKASLIFCVALCCIAV